MTQVLHTGPLGAELLVIGEAPGSDETRLQQPFVGQSGELLRSVLFNSKFYCASSAEIEDEVRRKGIGAGREINNKYNIRFANIANRQPDNNNFEKLSDGEVQEGVRELRNYISRYPPKVVLLCGNYALQYILNKYGITKWRGSVLVRDNILYIPTFHPANVLRNRKNYPIFSFDISKAFKVLREGFAYPSFNFTINPEGIEFEEAIHEVRSSPEASVDIETVKHTNRILCIGVGLSRRRSICIPNTETVGLDNNIRRFIDEGINVEGAKLTFHNGTFDVEILHNNQVEIPQERFKHDTMVMQHILAPEMPKGLDFITSIYTDIPYYKDKGKMTIPEDEKGWSDTKTLDKMTLYEYNCTDCCATQWCKEEMLKEILEDEDFSYIYPQEMSMHDVAFELTRSGVLIDVERNKLLLDLVSKKFVEDQQLLNYLAGYKVSAQSWQQKQKLLYEHWKLPIRTNKDSKTSTDDDAIVSLIGYTKDHINGLVTAKAKEEWQKKLVGLILIQKLQGAAKLIGTYLDIKYHSDGRARSVYKLAGPETARWACEKYYDDTGWNAQTLPRESIEA